jgi:hypothetical protein
VAGGVAQEVECLPSMHETLSSSPDSMKKEKKRQQNKTKIKHSFSTRQHYLCFFIGFFWPFIGLAFWS